MITIENGRIKIAGFPGQKKTQAAEPTEDTGTFQRIIDGLKLQMPHSLPATNAVEIVRAGADAAKADHPILTYPISGQIDAATNNTADWFKKLPPQQAAWYNQVAKKLWDTRLKGQQVNVGAMRKTLPVPSDVPDRLAGGDVDGALQSAKEDFARRQQAERAATAQAAKPARLMVKANADRSALMARVIRAAGKVHPNPSEAQKREGNYQKGRLCLHGMEISIETAKGQIRRGKDKSGKPWACRMAGHYGYILSSHSDADDQPIDVFIGPAPESEIVYVIDQEKPGGAFDESKVIMGCRTEAEAKKLYLDSYEKGWKGLGAITSATMDQLRLWLKKGDTAIRFAGQRLKAVESPRLVKAAAMEKDGPILVPLACVDSRGKVKAKAKVRLADDKKAMAVGLSGIDKLAEDEGMLFATPGPLWMAGCLIPLDAAWLSKSGQVVSMRTMPISMAPPHLMATYESSSKAAECVVEMNAGWLKKHGIEVGDRITVLAND